MIIPNKFNGYGLDGRRTYNWLPIAAAIAAVVGAALQQQGAQKSAKAVANAEAQSLRQQALRQDEINRQVAQRTQAYDNDTRQQQQEAIKQELTDTYTKAPHEATAQALSNLATQGNVSSDYERAKAASDQRVLDNADAFGKLMANVNSANRMRQLETIENAKAANASAVQQALMRGDARIGQYNMEKASHAGDTLTGLGQLSSLAGTVMGLGSMAGLGAAGTTTTGAGASTAVGSTGATSAATPFSQMRVLPGQYTF